MSPCTLLRNEWTEFHKPFGDGSGGTYEYFLLNSNAAKQPDYRVADFTAVGVFLVVAGMGRR